MQWEYVNTWKLMPIMRTRKSFSPYLAVRMRNEQSSHNHLEKRFNRRSVENCAEDQLREIV